MLYNSNTDIIKIHGTTTYLRHKADDTQKIINIADSMATNGWMGRAVIMVDCGDHQVALTGTHRLTAASQIGVNPDLIYLPGDLTADDFDLLGHACDDDDLLAAFEQIAASRDDMDQIVDTMRQEIEFN
jgi:hypothetical protein